MSAVLVRAAPKASHRRFLLSDVQNARVMFIDATPKSTAIDDTALSYNPLVTHPTLQFQNDILILAFYPSTQTIILQNTSELISSFLLSIPNLSTKNQKLIFFWILFLALSASINNKTTTKLSRNLNATIHYMNWIINVFQNMTQISNRACCKIFISL